MSAKKRKRHLVYLFIFIVIVFYMIRPRYNPDPALVGSKEDFIETYAPLAMEVADRYDLIPSVVLAQAAVESNYGESELAKTYNNYFGIKGSGEHSVVLPTKEIIDEKEQSVSDGFRTYDSPRESFFDYGKLIASAPRYASVREATTKEAYAEALYPAGYSTNPRYGEILLQTIAAHQLDRYDTK
ncbi:MAG: glucosaminidase domain-containing protein [Peptoniphilus sp.]|nr:glucosaminidase domain-containing protein [Peptoniphilus sp.]MDD7363506.1 glucosaminidase domain-containing protein [Bacillota bacterium]MDY6044790.1 glucosaminidase domain-containing protein [Peptoniphilus sp.]